jgi:NAD(P)-dependent dehydrogenase (short-subunit alcohol dehydrogenase family)
MMRKVALVTGGKQRIGAAIARHLAEAGYAVVVHGRDPAAAARYAETICDAGGQARGIGGELADLEGIATLFQEACRPFGPPDLLVNNASLFAKDSITTLEPDTFCANLAVNLQAPVLLAQAFATALPADERGAIVNIIDQRVFRLTPQFFSYTLAKSALWTATQTLAQALAPRIRVNGVGPGPVLPNIHDGVEAFQREAAGTLLERPIPPEDIAEAVLFLARSSAITGQMIAVDSGQHLGWRTPDIVE